MTSRPILMLIALLFLNAAPAFLQNNPEIVYAAEIDGNRDIYTMSADGTNIQRLTDDAAEESSPVWSPDHSQIAFISNRTGDFEIFVMNANGSSETNITQNNHYNSAPSWSPDGQKLLFISAGTRSNDIFMMNPDGSDPVAITSDGYEDLKAIFAPDGRSIFYISLQDDSPPALYVMDVTGQNARALLSDANEEYDAPTLSPDGQRLAYVVTRFDAQGNTAAIYTSDLNGGQVSLVTEIESAFVTSLSWSPQGDELVYALTDIATKRKQLYAINVSNGGSQILSDETVAAYDVSWSSFAGSVSGDSLFITAPGDFQSELGCAQSMGVDGDWAPECELSRLLDQDGDGIYTFSTQALPAGDYEVKIALNGTWEVNYGENGIPDGSNIPFSIPHRDALVIFRYDSNEHVLRVATLDNNALITAPGDFQSELGCAQSMGVDGDWAPECELSRLLDQDGDGIYTFSTQALPAGDYEVKIALNGTWEVNYGENGIPDGSNIPFSIPQAETLVVFRYDSFTHMLTIDVNS